LSKSAGQVVPKNWLLDAASPARVVATWLGLFLEHVSPLGLEPNSDVALHQQKVGVVHKPSFDDVSFILVLQTMNTIWVFPCFSYVNIGVQPPELSFFQGLFGYWIV
jgi:hypothetical protein